MRRFAALIASSLVFACQSPPSTIEGDASRPSLPDLPSDFTKYRNDFGARVDYSRLCEFGRPKKELSEAIVASRWEEVAVLSAPWLAQCPVDAHIHMWRAGALYELGRASEAEPNKLWFRGLIESVLASGDGKSPETAYITISVAEEYAVLAALRLRNKGQSLVGNPAVDMIAVEDENGEQYAVYFNPIAHFERLIRELPAQ